MNKKIIYILMSGAVSISAFPIATANEWIGQVMGGVAWTNFQGGTQNITVDENTVNQYTVTPPLQSNGLVGAGAGYQWDAANLATQLSLSAYYMNSAMSGVNSPLINGGNFDTLNYTVSGNSYALMVEPKFIWTTYAWQPYLLTGAGIAFNSFSDYNETPTNPNGSAVPTSTPFNGATQENFAYEFGIGIQHPFGPIKNQAPILALDYRFMNWGKTGLSTYTNQPSNGTLNFGQMTTNSVVVSLSWPIR